MGAAVGPRENARPPAAQPSSSDGEDGWHSFVCTSDDTVRWRSKVGEEEVRACRAQAAEGRGWPWAQPGQPVAERLGARLPCSAPLSLPPATAHGSTAGHLEENKKTRKKLVFLTLLSAGPSAAA